MRHAATGRTCHRVVVVLGIAAALAAGCAVKKGRSLVLVNLTSEVTALKSARVVVVHGSDGVVGEAAADWDGANPSPLQLGVYVSEDVSGTVDVYACGFAEGAGVAKVATPKMANVEAGASSDGRHLDAGGRRAGGGLRRQHWHGRRAAARRRPALAAAAARRGPAAAPAEPRPDRAAARWRAAAARRSAAAAAARQAPAAGPGPAADRRHGRRPRGQGRRRRRRRRRQRRDRRRHRGRQRGGQRRRGRRRRRRGDAPHWYGQVAAAADRHGQRDPTGRRRRRGGERRHRLYARRADLVQLLQRDDRHVGDARPDRRARQPPASVRRRRQERRLVGRLGEQPQRRRQQGHLPEHVDRRHALEHARHITNVAGYGARPRDERQRHGARRLDGGRRRNQLPGHGGDAGGDRRRLVGVDRVAPRRRQRRSLPGRRGVRHRRGLRALAPGRRRLDRHLVAAVEHTPTGWAAGCAVRDVRRAARRRARGSPPTRAAS